MDQKQDFQEVRTWDPGERARSGEIPSCGCCEDPPESSPGEHLNSEKFTMMLEHQKLGEGRQAWTPDPVSSNNYLL